ncbi:YpzG family protein [Bacillus sp. B190/17]|uniref:YpzG family protein n=1 Tax=Bacillus lumedeiriae TaxID=3058829 RepID=A0ABW8I695_9BACI
MTKKAYLDPKSQKIHHNWTRPKRTNSQVNGHTEMTLRTMLNKSVSNENRFC